MFAMLVMKEILSSKIFSSLLVAIVTSILSIIGTLYVQKRRNESTIKKNALILYLNLKQTKLDIDKDKKVIDGTGENEIMPMMYFNPFDYIAVLGELKDKLSEQEIEDVNNFYENVKKIDNKKMIWLNSLNMSNNFATSNPQLPNPYYQQSVDGYNGFKYALNVFVNSDAYKANIVNIISKLKNLK